MRQTARNLLLATLLCSGPTLAQETCATTAPDPGERLEMLSALAAAPDPATAQVAASKLWELWMTAPDRKAQQMLNDGMSRRQMVLLVDAEIVLDALVTYCPSYAEGWNQRAFVRYLRKDYDGSLADIERTLALEPAHFGALSGKALALMAMGRSGLAKLAMTRAVEVHPWLNERHILGDGEDI